MLHKNFYLDNYVDDANNSVKENNYYSNFEYHNGEENNTDENNDNCDGYYCFYVPGYVENENVVLNSNVYDNISYSGQIFW